jgi:creatinine amidohydrolase
MMFEALTRDQIGAKSATSLAVVPCGAIEQHGPHLAVGADAIFAAAIAQAAALAASPQLEVLVTPAIYFGISDHHKPHPGVLSLRPATFIALLSDVGRSLVESGFKAVAFVNGHNGNEDAIKLVARDLNNTFDAAFAATSYWTAAWSELEAADVVNNVARIPGHAGRFETSLMLSMNADFVRLELLPETLPAPADARHKVKPVVFPRRGNHGRGLGYSDAPREANRALGDATYAACVSGLAKFFIEFGRELVRS